jgi:hypothetical protein
MPLERADASSAFAGTGQSSALRERTRPRQASLRRALSTAYCALFHFLIRETVRQIGPSLGDENSNRARRWFDHGAMYRVARLFSQEAVRIGNTKEILILNTGSRVQFIAKLIADLQELRNLADYDPGATFIRSDTLAMVDRVESAFRIWPSCKRSPEANTFLLSLLLWEKWGKRF